MVVNDVKIEDLTKDLEIDTIDFSVEELTDRKVDSAEVGIPPESSVEIGDEVKISLVENIK